MTNAVRVDSMSPVANIEPSRAAPATALGNFVINLCASTTPMALVRPQGPELERFTFFVSRRREEGRERFRLHMGYFATHEDAQRLLAIVREVYPAAWVGEAPGRKLAAAAAASKTVQAAPTLPGAPTVAGKIAPPTAPHATGTHRGLKPSMPIKTLAQPASPVPASPAPAASAPPVVQRPLNAAATLKPAQVVRPAIAAKPALPQSSSNVREVIAALAPPPAAAVKPTVANPTVANPTARVAAPAAAPLVRQVPVADNAALTDSQVLNVLETRQSLHKNARGADAAAAEQAISLVKPEDSQTLRALRVDISQNSPIPFAVQLDTSANPYDVTGIPPLAIFNAYTLYAVEGSREGKHWYGLRLGFFTDVVAAKQVAYYVRSEFPKVAVVPVTVKERDGAETRGSIVVPKSSGQKVGKMDEETITLVDERAAPRRLPPAFENPQTATAPATATLAAAPATPAAAVPASNTAAVATGTAFANSVAAKRARRPRGAPMSMEETLEILGASQLSIDNGKGEHMNALAVRGRKPDKRTSTFSKLLDRLSDRLRS